MPRGRSGRAPRGAVVVEAQLLFVDEERVRRHEDDQGLFTDALPTDVLKDMQDRTGNKSRYALMARKIR